MNILKRFKELSYSDRLEIYFGFWIVFVVISYSVILNIFNSSF